MQSASQAEQSRLKRLFGAFVAPPTYDFWSRQLGSTHAWSRCHARVVDRFDASANTFTLRLAPNGNFRGFAPGQHVNLTAAINGRRVTRSYSFSNVPNYDGWVELTVRHDPSGLMSHWLFEHAHKGTVLELETVFGDMTADTLSDQPVLLLAGGSGITPLMSVLRAQAQSGMPQRVDLAYWETTEANFCFADELQQLAERFGNFRLHLIATHQDVGRRISATRLASLGIDVEGAQVLACGSSGFVDQARQCTAHAAASFTSEAFTPRPIATPTSAETHFTVELTTSKRRIEVSNQQSLLTALEQQGIAVQSGCRMGICNTCSCKKIAGVTQNTDTNIVDANTNTNVRLCVSQATSDLQLAL